MTVVTSTGASATRVGFSAALASEWVKLRTVRSTYIQIGLAIGLTLGMTALVAVAIGSTIQGLE